MTPSRARLDLPLGVDMIEIRKAKTFYRLHRRRLACFLTPPELRFIERQEDAAEGLAALFAGKEAAFKALGGLRGGIADFKNIRVIPSGKNEFRCSAKGVSAPRRLRITWFKDKKVVVARCAGIS